MKPSNEDRASWAQQAVAAFAAAINMEDEPLDTVIGDLLADLMHLCDNEKLDFNILLSRAQMNHIEEKEA